MLGKKFMKPLQPDTVMVDKTVIEKDENGNDIERIEQVETENAAENTFKLFYEAAAWANDNNCSVSDMGEFYEIVAIPEPTEEEKAEQLQQQYTNMIQRMLDAEAQKLGYDHCNSVCTYVETGVRKFDDEGAAFRKWRSAVWARGYELLAEVQAGTRSIPTEEELLELLPKLEIVYSVTGATDGQ